MTPEINRRFGRVLLAVAVLFHLIFALIAWALKTMNQ